MMAATAAMLIAELGDPARFHSAASLAAYVGLCPGHRHSGKHQPKSSSLTPIGNRRIRQALWMPALIAAMRKLLAAIYSVAKHRRPFVPFLHSQPLDNEVPAPL